MSFRWYIYYCSLLGGCAAYLGWALGRVPEVRHPVWEAAVRALLLGLLLAVVLALVDAAWNSGGRGAAARVAVAGMAGSLGGFVGGMVGQILYSRTQLSLFLLLGWAVTGLLIGAGPGLFDLLARLAAAEDARGAGRKVAHGVLGGAIGGLAGGLLYLLLLGAWGAALGTQADQFWSPSATGFVALGLCIGLFIGLAQVILREAWVKVEEGFRAGRELILTAPEVTIGRAEGCDVALFGDAGVEKLHARIVLDGGRYYLEDLGTPGGTFVNGSRVRDRSALSAGDEIRVGGALLRFGERAKRAEGGGP